MNSVWFTIAIARWLIYKILTLAGGSSCRFNIIGNMAANWGMVRFIISRYNEKVFLFLFFFSFLEWVLCKGRQQYEKPQKADISSHIKLDKKTTIIIQTVHSLHFAIVLHACYTWSARPANAFFIVMLWSLFCLPLANNVVWSNTNNCQIVSKHAFQSK